MPSLKLVEFFAIVTEEVLEADGSNKTKSTGIYKPQEWR